MRTRTVITFTSSALGGLLWMPAPSAALQHQHSQPAHAAPQAAAAEPREHELKVGKKGDIEFSKETIVGELRLKPGRYQFQHRVEGAEHFVRFEALATTTPSAQKLATGLGVPASTAGDVKCRVEPLSARAKDTTLHLLNEDAGQRLTKLLVRGESVAHLF